MKLHRFYINEMHNKFGPIALGAELWVHDEKILNQWLRVLRYKVDDSLVLFNDNEERLYKISEIEYPHSVKLQMITELERNIPKRRVVVLWTILKKDKNDWVLQKCTELGVREFVPVLSARGEKTGFNLDRAQKIVIEASEQCGRSDIPIIREPVLLHEVIKEYKDLPLYVCEQGGISPSDIEAGELAVLIGPEGGWSDEEKAQFEENNIQHLGISNFTLRAETAAVVSAALLA
jgi:16S rRNA (uracil1498-N3)-methyltransferase